MSLTTKLKMIKIILEHTDIQTCITSTHCILPPAYLMPYPYQYHCCSIRCL